MSGMLDSRSYNALAMLVSSSDGRCLDGLVAAILLSAAMIAVVVIWRVGGRWRSVWEWAWILWEVVA